jgi:Aspartyl protease/PDZ domain
MCVPETSSARFVHRFGLLFPILLLFVVSGCSTTEVARRPEGTTELKSRVVKLPATLKGNALIIEVEGKDEPYHFLIDTGSSVNLVTPDYAESHQSKEAAQADVNDVPVRAADGTTTELPPTTLSRIELGNAKFYTVNCLIYSCEPLSEQLGVKIDGILGFPLFKHTILTLDYIHPHVELRPAGSLEELPGKTVPFTIEGDRPLIMASLNQEPFKVLIDTGSDEALSLNPTHVMATYAYGPTEGPTVATLTGDRPEQIARLSENLTLGAYTIEQPVAELTETQSSIGGGILKYFSLTFDPENKRMSFNKEEALTLSIPGKKSTGLSFAKTPAYWRVVGVIPGSPADASEIEPGDLVIKINHKTVSAWDITHYDALLDSGEMITFTFLKGTKEIDKPLKVVDLIP